MDTLYADTDKHVYILNTQTFTETYEEKDMSGYWWEAAALCFHFTPRFSVLSIQ